MRVCFFMILFAVQTANFATESLGIPVSKLQQFSDYMTGIAELYGIDD